MKAKDEIARLFRQYAPEFKLSQIYLCFQEPVDAFQDISLRAYRRGLGNKKLNSQVVLIDLCLYPTSMDCTSIQPWRTLYKAKASIEKPVYPARKQLEDIALMWHFYPCFSQNAVIIKNTLAKLVIEVVEKHLSIIKKDSNLQNIEYLQSKLDQKYKLTQLRDIELLQEYEEARREFELGRCSQHHLHLNRSWSRLRLHSFGSEQLRDVIAEIQWFKKSLQDYGAFYILCIK